MREVTAAIIRRNGKILICRRAEGSCAHLWEFPGGRVEPGETPEQAVVREFAEETGFTVRVTAPLGIIRELREELNIEIKPLREYCRSVCGELSFVFIEAEIIYGEPQLSVHEKMRWVSPGELTAFEWCPADRTVAEMLSANCS